MVTHAWTIVCEKSIIDTESNNVSIDLLEQLTIRLFPSPNNAKGFILPHKVEIISLWYRHPQDEPVLGKARLTIVAPNGLEVGSSLVEIDLTKHHRCRTRLRLNSIPLPNNESGFFQFIMSVELNSKLTEVARIPLEIHILPAQ